MPSFLIFANDLRAVYTIFRDIKLRHCVSIQVTGGRNYSISELVATGDKENSAALNRFLENVLKARNNLKWIDEDARRINHRPRLEK